MEPNLNIQKVQESIQQITESKDPGLIQLALDVLKASSEASSSLGNRSVILEGKDPRIQDLYDKILNAESNTKETEEFALSQFCHTFKEYVQKELESKLWNKAETQIERTYEPLAFFVSETKTESDSTDALDITELERHFNELSIKIDQRLQELKTSHPEHWTPSQSDKEKWAEDLKKMEESWARLKERIKTFPTVLLFSDKEEERKKEYYNFGVKFGKAFDQLASKERENLALLRIDEFIGQCQTGWEEQINDLYVLGTEGPMYTDPTLKALEVARLVRRDLLQEALRKDFKEGTADVHYHKASRHAANEEFFLGFSEEELGKLEPLNVLLVKDGIRTNLNLLLETKGKEEILTLLTDQYKAIGKEEKKAIFEETLDEYKKAVIQNKDLLLDPLEREREIFERLALWSQDPQSDMKELKTIKEELEKEGLRVTFSALTEYETLTDEIKRTSFFKRLQGGGIIKASDPIETQIDKATTLFNESKEKPEDLLKLFKALEAAQKKAAQRNDLTRKKEEIAKYAKTFPETRAVFNRNLLEKHLLENEDFGVSAWGVQSKVLKAGDKNSSNLPVRILAWIEGLPFSQKQWDMLAVRINAMEEGLLKDSLQEALQEKNREALLNRLKEKPKTYHSLEEIFTYGTETDFDHWLNDYGVLEPDLIEGVQIAAIRGHLPILRRLLPMVELLEEARGFAVRLAAEKGHLEVVQELLKENAEILNEDRGRAVCLAADNGHVAVVKEFLKRSDPVWVVHLLVQKGHLEIVQELLKENVERLKEARGCVVDWAAAKGHVAVVQELLKGNAEISKISNKDRGKAVCSAAQNGHVAVVQELLKGDVEISKEDRGFAVYWLAAKDHLDVAKELLEGNAERSKEARGNAVKWAAQNGHVAVVQELLKGDVKISKKDRGFAVRSAAEKGHLEVVQELLEGDAEISNEDRGFAVRSAAEKGHLEIVQELLKGNAEISKISNEDRGFAVRSAAEKGHLEVVQELLKGNAEISKISNENRGKAVYSAAQKGHLEVVQELLKGNAERSKEARGFAVRSAAEEGHLELVKELLKGNAEISKEARGFAVRSAAEKGHLEVVKELLKGNAEISNEDRGRTVYWVAHYGDLEIVQDLLKGKAEISKSYRGQAVCGATENGHLKIVKELLKENAEISKEDRGRAVCWASENGRLEIVQELLKGKAEISKVARGLAVYGAAVNGHLRVVQELLEGLEGNVSIPEEYIREAKEKASGKDREKIIRILDLWQ